MWSRMFPSPLAQKTFTPFQLKNGLHTTNLRECQAAASQTGDDHHRLTVCPKCSNFTCDNYKCDQVTLNVTRFYQTYIQSWAKKSCLFEFIFQQIKAVDSGTELSSPTLTGTPLPKAISKLTRSKHPVLRPTCPSGSKSGPTQSSLGYIRENKGALKVPFYFPLSLLPPFIPLYSRLDWALNHL